MKKQVECISDGYYNLTKGKIYKVCYEYTNVIVVENDMGYKKDYPATIFRFLPTNKQIENKTKPTYYRSAIDVIDFCQINNLDFMQGNVIKYVTRYKHKNGKEDLLKAKEYIDRMIKEMGDK